MLLRLMRTGALLFTLGAVTMTNAAAQTILVPGPRITIPSVSPKVFAQIRAREAATRFVRLDNGPRYAIYGAGSKPLPFPNDLTPARGRAYIDQFAALAPSMNCRTDDVAHAYEILLQAALLSFNGTHFSMFAPGPRITCGARSFGAAQLDETVHIYLGGTPAFANLSNRSKQVAYEIFIVTAGYVIDSVTRARPGSRQMAKARQDASDIVKTLTGFSAGRVHLTEAGVSIDDQARSER